MYQAKAGVAKPTIYIYSCLGSQSDSMNDIHRQARSEACAQCAVHKAPACQGALLREKWNKWAIALYTYSLMHSSVSYVLVMFKILTLKRTKRAELTNIHTEQEYMFYFVGSVTYPNACYIHFHLESYNFLLPFV